MTLDWNWFFSAFAQCGAALIGIIAAFIISKLLGENDKYETIVNNLESLKNKRSYLIDKISVCRFDWYDRLNIEYGYDIHKAIEKGEFDELTDNQKLEKLFQINHGLFPTDNCLKYLNKEIIELQPQSRNINDNLSVSIP